MNNELDAIAEFVVRTGKALHSITLILENISQRLNAIEDHLHMGFEPDEESFPEFTQSELDDMMQRDLDEETLDAEIIPFGRKDK